MPIRKTDKFTYTRLGQVLDIELSKYGTADWNAVNKFAYGGSGEGGDFTIMRTIDLVALGMAISNPATVVSLEIFRFPKNVGHFPETGTFPSSTVGPPILIESCSLFVSTPLIFPANIVGLAPNSQLGISASLGKMVGPVATPQPNAQLCKMLIGAGNPRLFQIAAPVNTFHFGDRAGVPLNPSTAAINETVNIMTAQDRGASLGNIMPALVSFPDQDGDTSLIFEVSGFTNGGAGGPYVASSGIVAVYLTGKVLPAY